MSLLGHIWVIGRDVLICPPKGKEQLFSTWVRKIGHVRYVAERGLWSCSVDFRAQVEEKFIREAWVVSPRPPSSWQDGGGAATGIMEVERTEREDFEELFLLESAPKEVVIAAYKALCLMHHPDRGGDESRVKALNIAKDRIFQSKGW